MKKIIIAIILILNIIFLNNCSKESTTKPEIKELSTPSDLTLQVISDTKIKLNWVDNSSFEEGFEIQRKSNDYDFLSIAMVAANIDSFIDSSNINLVKEYTYRVRAFAGVDSSSFVSSNNIPISFPAPSSVIVNNVDISSVIVTWIDNSEFETGFEIERQLGTNAFEKITILERNITEFIDNSNPLNISPITYRVRASTDSNKSEYGISNSLKYKIVFQTNRDGNYELYSMNMNGGDQTNITNSSENELYPKFWSPDGKKILYVKGHHGAKYIMDYTGDNQIDLQINEFAGWAYYGNRVLYNANWTSDIYFMDLDGTNKNQVTSIPSNLYLLKCSPLNSKILFSDDTYMATMNIDGTNRHNITSRSAFASWSKDGSKIVFRQNYNIFKSDPEGNNVQLVIDDLNGSGYEIHWSPDGSKILFNVIYNLYLINSDGSNMQLLEDARTNPYCCWSPDGSKIIFTSAIDGDAEIYIMNSDGSNKTKLTNNSDWDTEPIISPIPLK